MVKTILSLKCVIIIKINHYHTNIFFFSLSKICLFYFIQGMNDRIPILKMISTSGWLCQNLFILIIELYLRTLKTVRKYVLNEYKKHNIEDILIPEVNMISKLTIKTSDIILSIFSGFLVLFF